MRLRVRINDSHELRCDGRTRAVVRDLGEPLSGDVLERRLTEHTVARYEHVRLRVAL